MNDHYLKLSPGLVTKALVFLVYASAFLLAENTPFIKFNVLLTSRNLTKRTLLLGHLNKTTDNFKLFLTNLSTLEIERHMWTAPSQQGLYL